MSVNRLPVTFSVKDEIDDSEIRFVNVTIDVMHTGDNLNKSNFSKRVIEKAIPTIANTPILGYIEANKIGEPDFKGHEHKVVVDDDGVNYVYAGSAYGVIPETCNPRWIVKDDGTGTEREYLRVDAIMWTKFDDAINIFERDIEKNHSVELCDMLGELDERGYWVCREFKFDGCCVLSTTDPKIKPAMTGSNIVADFSAASVAGQIKAMLNEYNKITKKGEYEMQVADIEHNEDVTTAPNVEEAPASEMTAPAGGEADPKTEEHNGQTGGEDNKEFALDLIQMRNEVESVVGEKTFVDQWGYECPQYWVIEITGEYVIVNDMTDWKIYGLPYIMNGDNVVIDFECKKRMKCTYVEWDEGETGENDQPHAMYSMYSKRMDDAKSVADELEKVKADYAEILPKYNAYVKAEADAKAAELQKKKESLFAIMDERLGDNEEYQALKDADIEFAELENKCYALVGKANVEFSYVAHDTPKNENIRYGVTGAQHKAEGKYGDLFERYGVK